MRNFLFTSDIAEAYDVVLHKGKVGEVYNIGTDFEIRTRDLAKLLIRKVCVIVELYLVYY